jgi:hypothetical protein
LQGSTPATRLFHYLLLVLAVLTKEKIMAIDKEKLDEALKDMVADTGGAIYACRAILAATLKTIEHPGLLSEWELDSYLDDAVNGNFARRYTFPRDEGCLMLQLPVVYDCYVDAQENLAALKHAANSAILKRAVQAATLKEPNETV